MIDRFKELSQMQFKDAEELQRFAYMEFDLIVSDEEAMRLEYWEFEESEQFN